MAHTFNIFKNIAKKINLTQTDNGRIVFSDIFETQVNEYLDKHRSPSQGHFSGFLGDSDNINSEFFDDISDEVFSGEKMYKYLRQLVAKRNTSNAAISERAMIDKSYLSKMLNNQLNGKQPSKYVMLGLAVALELTIDETEKLLNLSGYYFSEYDTDGVVRFCINHNTYNVSATNEYLYNKHLPLLGKPKKE